MSVECFCLTKRYGRRVVLDDVSLEINDGGVTGLIGPNGAGKSTLIKLITGLIWPTEGFVLVDGFDAHREHTKAMRRIGAVIEWPAFIPDLSARANLDIFSGGHGRAYREKRAEILRFMELESVLDRKVGSFSTGMRQRLGITLALLPDSEFIILDEPTNGLDPNQIVEVRRLIREIAKDRAVLISTHILPEVQAVCDYIMMIEHGQKVFEGTINAFNTYMSPSALLTIMHNAPSSEEFMKIEGVVRVERLTNTRIRLHFRGDDSIIGRVVKQAVSNHWHLREISLEKESLDKVFAKLSGKDA